MTAKKTTKKRTTKATAAPKAVKPVSAAQEAWRVTWVLQGELKRSRIAHLWVGRQLVDVRDRKLYIDLGHKTLEEYAEERLRLGKSSLYQYIRVYEWVAACHPEWLEPKPKGFIPDLNDSEDLMWIDEELKRKDLTAQARTELQALQAKGMDGRLKESDLKSWRKQGGRAAPSGLKSFLSKVRLLRKRGSDLSDMPAEAISHLDAAIDIIRNAVGTQKK